MRSIIWERRLKVRFFLGKVFERSTIWKTFLMSERLGGFCKFHQPSGIFSWDASFGTGLARSSFFWWGAKPQTFLPPFFLALLLSFFCLKVGPFLAFWLRRQPFAKAAEVLCCWSLKTVASKFFAVAQVFLLLGDI